MGYFLLFILIVVCIIWFGARILKGILNILNPLNTNNRRDQNQRQNSSQHESASHKNKQFEKTEGKYVDYEEITD